MKKTGGASPPIRGVCLEDQGKGLGVNIDMSRVRGSGFGMGKFGCCAHGVKCNIHFICISLAMLNIAELSSQDNI